MCMCIWVLVWVSPTPGRVRCEQDWGPKRRILSVIGLFGSLPGPCLTPSLIFLIFSASISFFQSFTLSLSCRLYIPLPIWFRLLLPVLLFPVPVSLGQCHTLPPFLFLLLLATHPFPLSLLLSPLVSSYGVLCTIYYNTGFVCPLFLSALCLCFFASISIP